MPSAAQRARDERAQALGYRNYYDYRVHGNGTIPPHFPAEPRRFRGHSGLRELLAELGQDRRRIESVAPVAGRERDERGRYREIRVVVQYVTGRERTFYLRGRSASSESLRMVRMATERPGALRRAGEGQAGGAYSSAVATGPDEEEEEDGGTPGEDFYLDDDYYWDEDYDYGDYDIDYITPRSLGGE